jgi:hypothetical protein
VGSLLHTINTITLKRISNHGRERHVERANRYWKLLFFLPILAIAVFLYGLDPWFRPGIETLKLPRLNPTSYVFGASIDQIHDVLRNQRIHCCGDAIEFSSDVSFSKGVLDLPGNENDAYIHNFHTPIGASSVYFARGAGLPYLCEFHLHMTPRPAGHTEVTVIPRHAEVITGLSWWGPHGSPANIYVTVAPTTVEEYKLLIELGEAVGQRDMPQLILPAKIQTTK